MRVMHTVRPHIKEQDRLGAMRVVVLYFGVLKDLLGCEREKMDLPEGSLAAALVYSVEQRALFGSGIWKAVAIAVNREYVRGSAVLHEGDEVALLPPVSGGCDAG